MHLLKRLSLIWSKRAFVVLVVLGTFILSTSQIEAQTWQKLATFDGYISFVKFLNDSTGFVGLGMSPGASLQQPTIQLYRTTDGGKSWNMVAIPAGYGGEIADILMVDSVNGWLAMTAYLGSGNKALWRTTDAGLTWNETSLVGSGTSVRVTPKVMVVTDLFNNGHVSTDGGQTFSNAFLSSTNCADFVDGEHGVVSDYRGDNWLYTSDSGLSWQASNMTTEAWTVYGVKGTPNFYAAPEGTSVGQIYLTEEGHVFKSSDYGAHWSAIANFPFIFTGCMAGIGEEWLFCQVHYSDTAHDSVNHGGFYYSTDQGTAWTGIGGPSAWGDTRFSVLKSCAGISIYGFDHQYNCTLYKYTFGSDGGGPAALSVPTHSSFLQTSCEPSDTAIPISVNGCIFHAMIDSIWITGSSAFLLRDSQNLPRDLSVHDSVLVSYGGLNGFDTALLHFQYSLGSAVQDTTIMLIGKMASPLLAHPVNLHREAASAYLGEIDTLPLQVDLDGQVNIDSIWPYLRNIIGTFSFDSSVVSFASYSSPAGWSTSSMINRGNAVDFEIHKISASAQEPLSLGTALFLPTDSQLATSWVLLPQFIIESGGQNIALCVTENEDSHWSVKTLGVLSGVKEITVLQEGLFMYPNPARNELFVHNENSYPATLSIYDGIGRNVISEHVGAASTTNIDIQSLTSGCYVVLCRVGDQVITRRLNKIR